MSLLRTMSSAELDIHDESESFDLLRAEDILHEARSEAHKSAHKLLVYLANLRKNQRGLHTIGTAESLTGGLMFSTLTDIPMFGAHKYGCFGVYHSDAKRIFLGVKVNDVYTHRCAKEMAEGILKNSNASIGIAVTGNAMPWTGSQEKLGEVFIGIAAYSNDNTIVCETYAINMCKLQGRKNNQCNLWYNTIIDELELQKEFESDENKKIRFKRFTDGYNDSILTSFVSNYIRNKTTQIAFEKAIKFLRKLNLGSGPHVPSWMPRSYIEYNYVYNEPDNFRGDSCQSTVLKPFRNNLNVICNNQNCIDETREGSNNAALFVDSSQMEMEGGRQKKKHSKKTN